MSGESLPEGYRKTKVGVIPVEWEEGPVSSIAFINPRTNTSHLKEDSPVSFLPMENVGEDGTVHAIGIRPYVEVQNGYTIFTDGDILFAKITPCMENGKGALVRDLINGVGFGSTEFHVLRPADPEDAEFIYQLSRASSFRTKATRYFTGSAGQQRVSKDVFTHYLCPIPTPEERHRIATILSTVDAAIAATDEVIAKTEDLKRGLMQDLLTKGIDEEGRVRSEETHEFCEKGGMRVPEEWDNGAVSDLFGVVTGTTPSTSSPEYWDDGTLVWITPADLSNNNGRVYISNCERKITDLAVTDYNLRCLPSGSIIVSTRAPVGYVALNRTEAYINQGCKGLIPNRKASETEVYYYYYLKSKTSELTRMSGGSTFKELSKKSLEQFPAPIPQDYECKQIGTILSTVDRDLAAERDHRARLQTLKKGLMQDLLTGRTRVPLNGGEAHGA